MELYQFHYKYIVLQLGFDNSFISIKKKTCSVLTEDIAY